MSGRALLASDAGPLPARDLVAELHPDPIFEEHLRPRSQSVALTRWPWKVIVGRDGAQTAYRLDRDPGESDPLGLEEIPQDLLRAAADRASVAAAAQGAGERSEIDPETLDGLRALGYAE